MAFPRVQVHKRYLSHQSLNYLENYLSSNFTPISLDKGVNAPRCLCTMVVYETIKRLYLYLHLFDQTGSGQLWRVDSLTANRLPQRVPSCILNSTRSTGGHRTRVAAVTLDNMAEDAVTASVSLRQILTVSVRYCGPAFVSWFSMLWDTLMRKPELQWFDILPQFRFKVSRGNEGVGHICFQGTRVSVGPDEGTAVYRWT